MNIRHFNIRVYAIITDKTRRILLSDEYMLDILMTKFPGGGLHFGEGTLDCLRREAMEEFGQEIRVLGHFYTTDFFQQSFFFRDHQLISIYYLAEFRDAVRFRISGKAFGFSEKVNGAQSFRWVEADEINPDQMTFPIDRKVAGMVRKHLFAG